MVIVYLELEPEHVVFNVFSNLEGLDDESLEHGRYISFSGKPEFSGTYKYTHVNLNKGGNSIPLPALASITIRESHSNPEIIGQLTYIENYSDPELGIKEPEQFSVEIDYPSDHFEKAWDLIGKVVFGKVKVTVAIKASETDISGHEAILDVEKGDTWSIHAFYLKRHEKRT